VCSSDLADPADDLLLLTRCQAAGALRWADVNAARVALRFGCGGEPLVDRRAAESVEGNHRVWCLAFANPLDGHHQDGLERLMIQGVTMSPCATYESSSSKQGNQLVALIIDL